MQNIFRKNTFIIMTTAIFSILIINFVLTFYLLQNQQREAFDYKIDQVIHTLENNQTELASIKTNLDEDYLTRARAAAYVLERNQEVLKSVSELRNLAELLDVDELHVIDGDGILIYSSVPKYIGMDFHDGEQTRGFLPILESDDEDAYVIQESQPNTAEGKIMKYVGVARKGEKGIVQVGLEPVRQMEAQARNTYDYIFSRFPTDAGEMFFAIDSKTNQVLGNSEGASADELEQYYQADRLSECENGKFTEMEDGKLYYVVTRKYGDVLIGASVPGGVLYGKIWKNVAATFVYLFFIEIIILILLNYLVRRKVIDGIHSILKALSGISNGNLDTEVAVGGNPEFEELSHGINVMVKSIVNTSDRISKIIEMSEVPLAAFEYQSDMKHVFVTSGFRDMINLPAEEVSRLCGKPDLFLQKIQEIMRHPVNGETDVFSIHDQKYICIHLSAEEAGYLGVITDATKDVLEKQRMQYENSHDQLTGLFKYRCFKEQMQNILEKDRNGKICACVMLDLDLFKEINDTYGHDVGDKYLISFAEMMKELPEEHCVPARRSGDEFCIFVYDCRDKEEARQILESFWMMLKERKVELTENHVRTISVSGGVAWIDGEETTDINSLLKQADASLYKAKQNAPGYYVEDVSG